MGTRERKSRSRAWCWRTGEERRRQEEEAGEENGRRPRRAAGVGNTAIGEGEGLAKENKSRKYAHKEWEAGNFEESEDSQTVEAPSDLLWKIN